MLFEVPFVILPVLLSGLTFIFFLKYNRLKILDYPLDFKFRLNNKRVFGKNKTIKGPLFMGVFTMIYGFITFYFLKDYIALDLSNTRILMNFFIVGLSYSLGELPNSFVKRQLSIAPSRVANDRFLQYFFKVLDNTDSLIACAIVYVFMFHISIKVLLVSIGVGAILHLLTDCLMIILQLKKKQ